MEVNRLFDLLPRYKQKFKPKPNAFAGKVDGKWVEYSIDQYIDFADNISYGLLELGIQKGDRIATISTNMPQWNFLDMGILQTGAIHVPVYPTISESDYKYILNHAEIKYVFVSGEDLLKKIEHIVPEVSSLEGIYSFTDIPDIKHLDELIELGRQNVQAEKLKELKASISADDIATLIYTSGTTGNPKGVMLTHKNIISNVKAVYHIFPVDETCRGVSYLPLCHVYERMVLYVYHYLGVSVYYVESIGKIADNIREIKPEIFTSVPRLLEKVYDKIIAKGLKLKGIQRAIFFWAVKLGLNYEYRGKCPCYRVALKIANKIVFKKWREALGGNLRVIVCGGAALQERLARVYTAAGIPTIEGYGLTETSPVIAVGHFDKNGRKFGTVGPPVSNVEVKIEKDGEICVKGPSVFQGYYKQPELTQEAIDSEGWFHTGDLGALEPEGQLKITGRKKEIFKTSLGKYINPAMIENKFKESPFIDNVVVLGENQKFAAAFIVPDFEHLRSWCDVKAIEYSSDEEMVKNPVIKKRIQREVDEYNKYFGKTEQIMSIDIIESTWSVDTGELTASLKLKRNFIMDKYKDRIEKLFN